MQATFTVTVYLLNGTAIRLDNVIRKDEDEFTELIRLYGDSGVPNTAPRLIAWFRREQVAGIVIESAVG